MFQEFSPCSGFTLSAIQNIWRKQLFPIGKTLFSEVLKPKVLQKKLPKRHRTCMYVCNWWTSSKTSAGEKKKAFWSRMKKQKDGEWWWLLSPGQWVSGLSVPKYHQGSSANTWVLNLEEIAKSLLFQLSQNMMVQSREPASGLATQLCDESGPKGISAFCSSPATEGFPVASILIGLGGSYPHVKSLLPWLGVSFWEGKIRK